MARLSLQEAAAKLGVSTRTLRRRIKAGRLYADLEDGKYFVSPTELDRLASLDSQPLDKSTRKAPPTDTVTLPRKDYDSLLYRLATQEAELAQARRLLEAPAKATWWRRLLGK